MIYYKDYYFAALLQIRKEQLNSTELIHRCPCCGRLFREYKYKSFVADVFICKHCYDRELKLREMNMPNDVFPSWYAFKCGETFDEYLSQDSEAAVEREVVPVLMSIYERYINEEDAGNKMYVDANMVLPECGSFQLSDNKQLRVSFKTEKYMYWVSVTKQSGEMLYAVSSRIILPHGWDVSSRND